MTKSILFGALLLILAGNSHAEKLEITCARIDNDETIDYLIDTAANTVSDAGELATDVLISSNRIRFAYQYKTTIFQHVINRVTGRLSIKGDGVTVSRIYLCDKNRPKF